MWRSIGAALAPDAQFMVDGVVDRRVDPYLDGAMAEGDTLAERTDVIVAMRLHPTGVRLRKGAVGGLGLAHTHRRYEHDGLGRSHSIASLMNAIVPFRWTTRTV